MVELSTTLKSKTDGHDRRGQPRICIPFPVMVEGKDKDGEKFKVNTILDNFSANGLYVRIMPCVDRGAKLSVTIGLSLSAAMSEEIPKVSVEGVVLRAEEKAGGACGIAVTFRKARFI